MEDTVIQSNTESNLVCSINCVTYPVQNHSHSECQADDLTIPLDLGNEENKENNGFTLTLPSTTHADDQLNYAMLLDLDDNVITYSKNVQENLDSIKLTNEIQLLDPDGVKNNQTMFFLNDGIQVEEIVTIESTFVTQESNWECRDSSDENIDDNVITCSKNLQKNLETVNAQNEVQLLVEMDVVKNTSADEKNQTELALNDGTQLEEGVTVESTSVAQENHEVINEEVIKRKRKQRADNALIGDEFMRQIEPIAAYLPYMTCPGNHEEAYNFSNYRYRFSMPGGLNSPMYSINVGPMHIISISTEVYYFLDYGIKPLVFQYEWLEEDLATANLPENREKQPWIIVMGHRPMYCSNTDHDDCTHHETITRVGLPFLQFFGLENLLYNYGSI
ncbi:unnamed protein product [Diabrotica balteata]|uniref:Calcineurin-like phosphoesterase domain-containing protein n=1 Tax=Diabrotica balteata TaxID=107213 RepID=A0A9N9SYV0_DIABA|nr:unnamed protein product [Diabrotica balteata]